jgi:hypothetical protein
MPYQQNDWGGNALDNYLIGKVGRREFCIAWCSSAEAQWNGGATLLGSLACESALPPQLAPLLCHSQNHG